MLAVYFCCSFFFFFFFVGALKTSASFQMMRNLNLGTLNVRSNLETLNVTEGGSHCLKGRVLAAQRHVLYPQWQSSLPYHNTRTPVSIMKIFWLLVGPALPVGLSASYRNFLFTK